jgi:hypothetical protein
MDNKDFEAVPGGADFRLAALSIRISINSIEETLP